MQATTSPPSPSEAPAEPLHLRIVAVDREGQEVRCEGLAELERAAADPELRLWVDLGSMDSPTLERVGRVLGLHLLILTNIAESNQRAKAERIEDDLHLVLFAVRFAGEVQTTELDFVLGPRFLLTVHEPAWDPRAAPALEVGPARVLARGPDFLLYALADWIVDGYFPVLDRLTDEIDQLQDDVMERPSSWTLERLFVLKRELIELRRAVSPAREMFNQLTNRELGLIGSENVVYFRDVYDHLVRLTEELDNYRELISVTLDVYLSSISNELSNTMKRLTGVTVILAGIGAVAGIFGMSEAGLALSGDEAVGFWIVAGMTVLAAVTAAVVLRRINWI